MTSLACLAHEEVSRLAARGASRDELADRIFQLERDIPWLGPLDIDAIIRAHTCTPRVGFITPSLGCGGAERQQLSLAKATRRIRWTGTAVVRPQDDHGPLRAEMAGLMPVSDDVGAARRLALASDVLVAWGVANLPQLLGDCKARVVFVSHGQGQGWTRKMAEGSRSAVTHWAAVSTDAAKAFEGIVPLREVEVIANGIEPRRCWPTASRDVLRSGLGYNDKDVVAGFVGRLSLEKRPMHLARAVALLPRKYKALYVGGGLVEAEVRKDATALLGDRVQFRPAVMQVGDVLGALDVFFLASPSEGFALAPLEAMLAGVPVVATEVGGLPEIRERFGEVWWPIPVDGTDWQNAAAIREAVEGDRHERRRRIDDARRMVEWHYVADNMAATWETYLERIAGEPL